MSFVKKFSFVLNNPEFVFKYVKLKKQLVKNKKNGITNWVFQCDFKGHFSYLKPYYKYLKNDEKIDVYFSLNPRNTEESPRNFLIEQGIPINKIIEPADYVALLNFDVYMSPTEWGNIFPKNPTCLRTQIFHTLADKGLEYSKALLNFNTIFANGPIHHDFLEKYIFKPFPESKEKCKVFNVGFAKVDELFDGTYSKETLKETLNINKNDKRLIVLYAPNWEKSSALHKYGESAFKALQETNHLIIIKLHYMSRLSPDNEYATGGIDWNKLLDKYRNYENVRIIDDYNINPYIYLADVMVTDYGGASLEFMIMDKPIIYLDCPAFFDERGHHVFEKNARQTGYLIDDIHKISSILNQIVKGDDPHLDKRRQLNEKLLYNRGKAAQTGIQILKENIKG